MMGWYDDVGGGWVVMTLVMIAFWVVVAWVVVQVVLPARDRGGATGPQGREILDQRLARGEIDVAEYRERLAAMGSPR